MTRDSKVITGIVLDEALELDLPDLCRLCDIPSELIISMVDEGIAEPLGHRPTEWRPTEWRFAGPALVRIRIALKLQRDLGVNLAGAALILDLLDELEALRQRARVRVWQD